MWMCALVFIAAFAVGLMAVILALLRGVAAGAAPEALARAERRREPEEPGASERAVGVQMRTARASSRT